MKPEKHLLDWLRDAHAMEKQAVEILEKQARRLENYPEMQRRVQQHVEETKSQAQRVESCIKRYDGDTSALKDITGKLSGNIAAMTNAMATDEVVKNAIADYAFENFEIASYRALVETAEALGDRETATICRDILREEEAMASWVADNLPTITRAYLEREAADVQSKR